MIVDLQESYPCEFNEDPAVLREKLHKAMRQAMPLSMHKGGEMRVVGELAALTEKLYAERTAQLCADLAKASVDLSA